MIRGTVYKFKQLCVLYKLKLLFAVIDIKSDMSNLRFDFDYLANNYLLYIQVACRPTYKNAWHMDNLICISIYNFRFSWVQMRVHKWQIATDKYMPMDTHPYMHTYAYMHTHIYAYTHLHIHIYGILDIQLTAVIGKCYQTPHIIWTNALMCAEIVSVQIVYVTREYNLK